MPRDLDQLLRDTAVEPSTEPDVGRLVARGRRRRRLRLTTVGLGATVVVLAAVIMGVNVAGDRSSPAIVDQPSGGTQHPTASPDASEASGPSQTAAEARRDGVLPEVAALTFRQRVDIGGRGQAGTTARAETEEGVWVVSRLAPAAGQLGDALGDTDNPDAVYRRDVVSVSEYGEVLLLNHDGDQILRAFPLPGLPPQRLAVSDDAVWCGRQGDGGLPNGMLCRIDRQSFDWQVRVFPNRTSTSFTTPGDAGSGVDPETGQLWLPDNWVVDDGPVAYSQTYLGGRWRFEESTLVATSQGELRYDPATLAPVPPCKIDVTTQAAESGTDVTLTTTITLADGDDACGFDPHVGHELYGADGWPLPTEEQASQPTQALIELGAPLQVTAVWSNWCGPEQPTEVVFAAGPFGQWSSPLDAVPPCQDDTTPSQLEATGDLS